MIIIEKNSERVKIKLEAMQAGKDICLLITGGDTPHIGAVSVYSIEDKMEPVLFEGHKDDKISEYFINNMKHYFKGNISVSCGIHIDNITREEINIVMDICRDIADELKKKLCI